MISRSMQEQSEVECMKRILIKILLLPVYLILKLASVIYDMGLRVYSFGSGLAFVLLTLFVLLAGFSRQWQNMGIIALIIGGVVLVTVVVGLVGATIEILLEKIKEF